MTFAFSAAPRPFLASCKRTFSFPVALRSLSLFAAVVVLLISGSALSAQENGTSSPIADAPFRSFTRQQKAESTN